MSGMIFANKMQIEVRILTEIFGGMIAYDFIKITCCQKLQKVDFGWLGGSSQPKIQAQYSHFPSLFVKWQADLCANRNIMSNTFKARLKKEGFKDFCLFTMIGRAHTVYKNTKLVQKVKKFLALINR